MYISTVYNKLCPLHFCCCATQHLASSSLALVLRIEFTSTNQQEGRTALMMAAGQGQASTVTLLLVRRADTSVIDNVSQSSANALT